MSRVTVTFAMLTMCAVGLFSAFAAEAETKELPVALEGNCAVCLLDGGAVVKGTEKFAVEYDGQQYLFPDESTRKKFAKNPEKYAPVLNGDCTVCYQHGGSRPAGKVEYNLVHEGRLYLFPSEGTLQEFKDNPDKYKNVDLAFDGNCAICLKNGNESEGKPEFTARYKGMRYQFPNKALVKKFEENPALYAVADETEKEESTKPDTKGKTVSIEGRSACAGCEFKVRPTLNPEELGLAVVVSDSEIYIIENAHKSYSKIYDDRFDSLKLAVKGKVVKKEGRYTWVEPEVVKIAQ